MIYSPDNVAQGCSVYDVDAQQQIHNVMAIDTQRNVLELVVHPLEVTASGDIATKEVAFRSIYPIHGGNHLPCLFHCYGRLA